MARARAEKVGINRGRVPARHLVVAAIWLSVLASLFFLPGGLNRWVFPKEAALLAAGVVASRLVPVGRMPRWLLITMTGGAVILAVAALQSDAASMQFLGRWPRYEGAITLTV
jgi:uncharacterized membrane protein